MPDDEVGACSQWNSRLHYQVLALHPDLEVVRQPRLKDGFERLSPRDASDSWQFRLRLGAGPIQFGDPVWNSGSRRRR